jgi:uncharacterized RDD family membrane protein YckC
VNRKEMNAGHRILAMLLDHIVLTFAIMIIASPVFFVTFNNSFTDEPNSISGSTDWTLYYLLFCMSLYFNKDMIQGKSVAKRVLKQEVVSNKTDEVASSIKCLIRNLTIVIWPIEVIVVLISPSRRIGDFIAGTRVEYIIEERNSKPKIDFKNIMLSISIGFIVLLAGSLFFKGKIGNGAFDNPDFVADSYNRTLSTQIENHLDSTSSVYLIDTHIKVYDTIRNDSLKYIAALFYLTENYIDNSSFENVKQDIFNSMFEVVPKSDFILMGKFIFEDNSTKKTTWRTYDWTKTLTASIL